MKKNILYIHRTQAQGAEGSHIRGVVDAFRRHGWTVDIVGPPAVDPYKFQQQSAGTSSFLRRTLYWFADRAPQVCFETAELLYNVVAWWLLHKQWNAGGGYVFLYERYALNSFAGTLLASTKHCRLVLEVNDATVIKRSRPLVWKSMARWLERWMLGRAHLIVTISSHFKKLLVSHYGLNPDRILVLPNAIDPHNYELDAAKRLERPRFGIPEDSIVLGCVGAFVSWHGLEFLLESMAGQCEQHNLRFLFVGDGPVRAEVEEKARLLGIANRVLFTHFVAPERVPYFLDIVDICVIAGSNSHGSPMKLFECMAAGKPVVLPRYEPLLDVITEAREGSFFQPDDRASLRKVVLDLVVSREKRVQLGRNAKKTVMTQYTWSGNALTVLDQLGL